MRCIIEVRHKRSNILFLKVDFTTTKNVEDLNAAGILTFDVDIIIGTQTRSLECWDGVSFRSEVKSNSNPAKARWNSGGIAAQTHNTTWTSSKQKKRKNKHIIGCLFAEQ